MCIRDRIRGAFIALAITIHPKELQHAQDSRDDSTLVRQLDALQAAGRGDGHRRCSQTGDAATVSVLGKQGQHLGAEAELMVRLFHHQDTRPVQQLSLIHISRYAVRAAR